MEESKIIHGRGIDARYIPQQYFTVHLVPFHWIDPNRFSKDRLQKILDKPRRVKAIFNVLIVTVILLLVSAIAIGIIVFLGWLLGNSGDSILFILSASCGIGLGLLKDYLIERFPINRHDSNMVVRVKGIKYNSFNERT